MPATHPDDINLFAGPFCRCGDYSCRANRSDDANCDNVEWPRTTSDEAIAREEWQEQEQHLIDAEDEPDLALAEIAEMQRTGGELPVWALKFLSTRT